MAGARSLTKAEIDFIREMILKGQTIKEICKGVGLTRPALEESINLDERLAAAMNQAKRERMDEVAKLAYDAVKLLLTKHKYTEVKERLERVPKTVMLPRIRNGNKMRDKTGAIIYDEHPVIGDDGKPVFEEVVVERTKTTKVILPNASVAMWAAVNAMPDQFKTANKADTISVSAAAAAVPPIKIEWKGAK